VISVASSDEEGSLKRLKPQILEELNVKKLKFVGSVTELDKPGYAVCSEGSYAVAVSTEISTELATEGMAREVVHRLQTMRRSAGFDIADYIVTYYQGDDYIRQVMTDFADYIKQETLSQRLIEGISDQDIFTESHKLGGHEILLGVKKLG